MSLAGVAQSTLEIIERGVYRAPSGREVTVREAVDACVRGTVLYTPTELDALCASRALADGAPRIEVTPESTAEAGRRLTQQEGERGVCALSFASARHPGGGFLRGAKSQEEDLARCSALYPALLTQRAYYDANRENPSLLYTDHVIHSPEVPFFRDEHLALLDAPFAMSIVTAPAPNAGEVLRRDPDARPAIAEALRRRAGMVLAVAADRGHRVLVLGAWGCGVFRNDPDEVAGVFFDWLRDARFGGAFDRVVFAIHDRRAGHPALGPFVARV